MEHKLLNGSMTIEMSFLMPIILFLIMNCILVVFYYHDKNVLAGAAYETAVVGSTKAREKEGVKEEEIASLFEQRAKNKCILFSNPDASITASDEEIEVAVTASRSRMHLTIIKKAAVTEPEKYIRDIRRWKENDGTKDYD